MVIRPCRLAIVRKLRKRIAWHPERQRPFLLTGEGWPYLLMPLIPVAIFLELIHAGRSDLHRVCIGRHSDRSLDGSRHGRIDRPVGALGEEDSLTSLPATRLS
jgi:hypothetical protein